MVEASGGSAGAFTSAANTHTGSIAASSSRISTIAYLNRQQPQQQQQQQQHQQHHHHHRSRHGSHKRSTRKPLVLLLERQRNEDKYVEVLLRNISHEEIQQNIMHAGRSKMRTQILWAVFVFLLILHFFVRVLRTVR